MHLYFFLRKLIRSEFYERSSLSSRFFILVFFTFHLAAFSFFFSPACFYSTVIEYDCVFFTTMYFVCIAVFTLDAGLLARSQYSEGSATGHLDTGFSWFPCVYKEMLRWFQTFQVTTTCFLCSPPDLNLFVTNFIFYIHIK